MKMNENPCDACSSRRDFLKTGASLAALLAALPILEISGFASDGEMRYPVPASDSANIDYKSQVILVRYQGAVFAFALSCPHQNNAIKWVAKEGRFQCTKHDSRYLPNGTYTSGRATRNMDRFAVRREGDSVVVDLKHWFQSDKDPSGWASALIRV